MIHCSDCKQIKPNEEFAPCYQHRGSAQCRACMRERSRRYDAANRQKRRDAARAREPERYVWQAMKQRCHNPDCPSYYNYGGRGIRVCERWMQSFENFIQDVGRRPSEKHSIERLDNNGNYEPGNVAWVTRKVQQRNRRVNLAITYNGKTQCAAAWAEEIGMNEMTLIGRLNSGWDVDRAITQPVNQSLARIRKRLA